MESLRNINLEPKKIIKGTKARIAVSVLMTTGVFFSTAQAEGKSIDIYAPTPPGEFHPIVLSEIQAEEKEVIVTIPPRVPLVSIEPISEPTPKPTPEPDWKLDPEISFYGPGFYGNRTACGETLTTLLKGVASKTLPCGTLVTFNWEGITRTFPVVDRGPYVNGRIFDLTGGACMAFKTPEHPKGHCFTGPINYIIEK